MLRRHLPLVRLVVDRLRATLPAHVEAEDLSSAGLVGLIQAMRKFDPGHGVSFAGFAVSRIRGAVLDELRRMDWMSRSARGKARMLSDAVARVEQRVGRPALDEEVAAELSLGAAEYRALREEVKPVSTVALDEPLGEDREETLHEMVADGSQPTASELAAQRELMALIGQRLRRMPDGPKNVLEMYYFEHLRLAEIAEVFGVTESRICQIHARALQSLRTYTRSLLNR